MSSSHTTMESTFTLQNNLGSIMLLTNKTTQVSNKILTLASPRPREEGICRHVRITTPTIGTVWYLPVCWLFHIYLEYTCIREMNCPVISVIHVLLALSLVVMLLFTATIFLKVERVSSPEVGGEVCKLQKSPALKCLLPALTTQKYPLQALAALLLIHSYLLLQLRRSQEISLSTAADNETQNITGSGLAANNSEAATWTALHLLSPGNGFMYILYCVNFAIPLIIHSVLESDPVWQRDKLWGGLYSVILLLTAVRYPSSSFCFFSLLFTAYQSPHSLLFQGSPVWLPALYVTSILSTFLYSLSLKVYVELCCRVFPPGSSATNLTLRRKMRPYPSPLGVILTTLLLVACEIPPMLELYFQSLKTAESFILSLFAFNLGFCLLCICVSVALGLRRSYRTNKARVKQRRTDSGLCLANSFVYQSSPNAGKTK